MSRELPLSELPCGIHAWYEPREVEIRAETWQTTIRIRPDTYDDWEEYTVGGGLAKACEELAASYGAADRRNSELKAEIRVLKTVLSGWVEALDIKRETGVISDLLLLSAAAISKNPVCHSCKDEDADGNDGLCCHCRPLFYESGSVSPEPQSHQ